MLYLHFHKAHEPQTYQSGDFGWGDSTFKVTWHKEHAVTWQNKNVYIFISTRPMAPKCWQHADSGWGGPTQKITQYFDPIVTWQIKIVIFSQWQSLWPPNLVRWVLKLRGCHAQSKMILLFRSHVLSSLSHGLWSAPLAKDDRISLKKFTLHATLLLLDKLKTFCLTFLGKSNLNCFFT